MLKLRTIITTVPHSLKQTLKRSKFKGTDVPVTRTSTVYKKEVHEQNKGVDLIV